MLITPHLLWDVADVGFELEAISLERRAALLAGSALEGAALCAFLDAQKDDGPALTPDERGRLEQRLRDARARDAPPLVILPLAFELGRTAFVRELAARDDAAACKGMLPRLACRDRLVLSRRTFESLLWLLVPPLRRERASLVTLPTWVARDLEITAAERPAVLNASAGFRALAGNTVIEGLAPSPYGWVRHVPNVTRAEDLAALQAAFEAALPSDLAALLPEWRCTFPGAYHDMKMRFALNEPEDPETQAFAASLSRDADWHFADAMAEVNRASTQIRAFRLRAARQGSAVVTTDGLDA